MGQALRIAVIAGEESGDLLAADLVDALGRIKGHVPHLVGVGGRHLQVLGLKSLFDVQDISLMGLGSVLKNLPRLMVRIHQTTTQIVRERPDCLIIVDNPDFTHRVAKKVRAKLPNLPIVQYIAPSVWAWRPERAAKMRPFIDHVLAVLPFEVQAMAALNGPPTSYVGHRLLSDMNLLHVRAERMKKSKTGQDAPTLLLLPGSRCFEIERLMPLFVQTVDVLHSFAPNLRLMLPTLPNLQKEIEGLTANWPVAVDILVGEAQKNRGFVAADVALAASGTVSLELALAGIPMVLTYKADWFSKNFLMPKVTVWSAALPNIIADAPIVPEYFNEFIRPGMLARQLYRLMEAGATRQAQTQGFCSLWEKMQTEHSAGEIAARVVAETINAKKTKN